MRALGSGHTFLDWIESANCVLQTQWVMRGPLSLNAKGCNASGRSGLTYFKGQYTMQAFLWQDDLIGVAKFINACLQQTLTRSNI